MFKKKKDTALVSGAHNDRRLPFNWWLTKLSAKHYKCEIQICLSVLMFLGCLYRVEGLRVFKGLQDPRVVTRQWWDLNHDSLVRHPESELLCRKILLLQWHKKVFFFLVKKTICFMTLLTKCMYFGLITWSLYTTVNSCFEWMDHSIIYL